MPALMDLSDRISSRFVSRNALVEDPCAVEKERAMINPWSSEEKKIFIDNLAIFGKNFRKIASFLRQKTTADCVEFYYKNHKSDCFQKKKKLVFRKHQDKGLPTSTYLVTSEKKRNRNISSSIAADTMGSDRETDAADALMEICSIVSSEAAALNNSITVRADPSNGCSTGAVPSSPSHLLRNSMSFADDEEETPTDWTDTEKCLFLQALSTHGKEFTKISQFVRTKSRDQCRIFFSKARKCLRLDSIHRPNTDAPGVPRSDEHENATTLRVKVVNPTPNSAATRMEEDKIPFSNGEDEPNSAPKSSHKVKKKDTLSSETFSAMENGGGRQGSCLKKCKSLKMNRDGPWDDSDT